jgi:crotonobetainyl-CoA:carnitine CoA-transferase CaiB-like acyl-CoA transferase
MIQPLVGKLVIAVEQAVAAPYCSARLAAAGARVVKVERPEGDFARRYDDYVKGDSAYFVWLNRGKESVCLDLKDASDADLLRNMVRRADILIQNLVPGAMERLGLGLADMRAENDALITVSISGYGTEGSLSHLKAYDLLVQAESGLAALTANSAGPARVGVSVCDIAAGMTAYQAVLEALLERERTGKGLHIDVSLFHAVADWMNVPMLQYVYGGRLPEGTGLSHPTIAPYGMFTCGDGLQVLISIQNEREWEALCRRVIELPELVSDPRFSTNTRRVEARAALDAAVQAAFSGMDRDEAIRRLESSHIAYGRISTMDDLIVHPQNQYVEAETSRGEVVRLLSPGASFDGGFSVRSAVPALGAHTATILAEFASGPQGNGRSGALADSDC